MAVIFAVFTVISFIAFTLAYLCFILSDVPSCFLSTQNFGHFFIRNNPNGYFLLCIFYCDHVTSTFYGDGILLQ